MKALLSWFVLLGVLATTIPAQARVIEKILAIVNDEIITQTDLERFRAKLASGGLVDDAVLRLANTKALLKGLSVTVERIEQEIRNITRRNGISRNQLKSALKEKGVDFSEYQGFIRTSLERQSLIEKAVSSKIKISDDDVSSYYVNQMGDKNANIFEYTLAHILFRIKKSEKEARKKARLVEGKLKSGSLSFQKLASQFSEDPNFSQGGILGTFKAGEMLPAMEKAIRPLKVGESTGVIKTRVGLHIVKLIKKTLVPNPAYESKKEEIRGLLFGKAFKKQFRNWLDGQRRDSFIRIN